MTPDAPAEVEEANANFYRAFESLDMAQMSPLWSHGEHVRCIHPGWCLLSGWDAVRQSWDAIFKSGQEMRFSIADADVHVEGDLAWVTCTENILSQTQGQIAVTRLIATNVFERMGDEWRMIHHHASHVLTNEPPASE